MSSNEPNRTKPIFKASFKIACWFFYAFSFLMFTSFVGSVVFTSMDLYPAWLHEYADRLITNLEKDGEGAMNIRSYCLFSFDLAVLSATYALVCLGIKWRMSPEKSAVVLGKLFKYTRWFLIAFVVIMVGHVIYDHFYFRHPNL